MAVLVGLAPDFTPTIIAAGCVAGSYLLLWLGRTLRMQRRAVHHHLVKLEEKLAEVGSQTTLAEIRLAELNLLPDGSNNTRLASPATSPAEPTVAPHDGERSVSIENADGSRG